MHLTDEEKRMQAGEEGEAVRLSMQILTRLGDVYGAERLVPVRSVHAACVYPHISVAVEMLEKFAGLGGRFRTLTTANPILNPCNFDRWPDLPEPDDLKQAAIRQMNAIRQMGVIPNWTCTPYFSGNLPLFGEPCAWIESSAIIFANSVLGARTNRNTMGVDISAAITGRVPEYELLLDDNRAGDALVKLEFQAETMFDYNAVGFIVGKKLAGRVPVIEGLPAWTTANHLKVLGAAAATKGGLALYHAVGITPEATTREQAFHCKPPQAEMVIKAKDVQAATEEMSTVKGGRVDAVLIGCPHPSVGEIGELAGLLKGRRVLQGVKFLLFASADTVLVSRQMGFIDVIEESGARILEGDCILFHAVKGWGWKRIATDSAKYALTLPSAPTNFEVLYRDTKGCVELATA